MIKDKETKGRNPKTSRSYCAESHEEAHTITRYILIIEAQVQPLSNNYNNLNTNNSSRPQGAWI